MEKIESIVYELGKIKCQTEKDCKVVKEQHLNCLDVESFALPYDTYSRSEQNDEALKTFATQFALELTDKKDDFLDPFWMDSIKRTIECAIMQLVEQKGVATKEKIKKYFQVQKSCDYQDYLRDYLLKNKDTVCIVHIKTLLMIPPKTMETIYELILSLLE